MHLVLSVAHIIGFSAFLGSIAVYIVISAIAGMVPSEALSFGRAVIEAGTEYITVPGLWLVAVTGVAKAAKTRSLLSLPTVRIKLALTIAMLANTHLIIMPAVRDAATLAREGVQTGSLPAAYASAYYTESVAGAFNVLMAVTCAGLGVFLARSRQR